MPAPGAALVSAQLQRLRAGLKLHPVIATELEFYLPGSQEHPEMPAFWERVREDCGKAGIRIFNVSKERGIDQQEIALAPGDDPILAAGDAVAVKQIIAQAAASFGKAADFSARPYADRPGSGLHVHLNLVDKTGSNVFYKDDDAISEALKYSIGGLLAWLPDCMPVFAPHPGSYARFSGSDTAPRTVSWGANNRTVAIRLPQSPPAEKRIEHRVPGSDADPFAVIAVILAAIHYGCAHRCDIGPQIHGDASLPQYHLPRLPLTPEDALARMRQSTLFEGYFSISDLL